MDEHKTCKHAAYDETWGEYKCKKHEFRIYDVESCSYCPDYKKNKKKEAEKER